MARLFLGSRIGISRVCSTAAIDCSPPRRSLPHHLHLIASSRISSAQYGHFFIGSVFRADPQSRKVARASPLFAAFSGAFPNTPQNRQSDLGRVRRLIGRRPRLVDSYNPPRRYPAERGPLDYERTCTS